MATNIAASLRRLGMALALGWGLAGCAGSGAFNTIAEGADSRLMLQGHDPVAYFTVGRHTPGKAEIKRDFQGVTYRFASAENRAMFDKEPAKYAPQFGGFCANGIAYAIPWGGDADTWALIEGKLYIFGGQSSKNYFMMDEKKNLALAHEYWDKEVRDSTPFIQRYKRLIFRVPHYKTGKELAAEWEHRKAQK
jgi:YHS domain-containing protein